MLFIHQSAAKAGDWRGVLLRYGRQSDRQPMGRLVKTNNLSGVVSIGAAEDPIRFSMMETTTLASVTYTLLPKVPYCMLCVNSFRFYTQLFKASIFNTR